MLLLASAAPLAAHGTLLLDGGFEPAPGIADVYPQVDPHLRYSVVPAPGGSLGAWSVTADFALDLMGSSYVDAGSRVWNVAYDGDQYVYISDSYPLYGGTISQTVSLTTGQPYRLSFAQADFPNDWDGSTGWVRVDISAGAYLLQQEFTVGNIGGWVTQSLGFSISGTPPGLSIPATFTFVARVGNPGIIDDVRLEAVAVPEASTTAGVLVGTLGLAATACRRRCMSAAG